MSTKEWHGWAIDTRSEEGHGMLGVGYFDLIQTWPVCRTAIFATRKEAREKLRYIKARPYVAFPDAVVVRVVVTVSQVQP